MWVCFDEYEALSNFLFVLDLFRWLVFWESFSPYASFHHITCWICYSLSFSTARQPAKKHIEPYMNLLYIIQKCCKFWFYNQPFFFSQNIKKGVLNLGNLSWSLLKHVVELFFSGTTTMHIMQKWEGSAQQKWTFLKWIFCLVWAFIWMSLPPPSILITHIFKDKCFCFSLLWWTLLLQNQSCLVHQELWNPISVLMKMKLPTRSNNLQLFEQIPTQNWNSNFAELWPNSSAQMEQNAGFKKIGFSPVLSMNWFGCLPD